MTHACKVGLRYLLVSAAVPASLLAVQNSAYAQTAATPGASSVEDAGSLTSDIVVTAQRRDQQVDRVGISITAFSGAQLTALGINNAADIAKQVPGVVFESSAGGGLNAQLTIRGVAQSDFAQNQESPNAIYLDNVYISSPYASSFDLFDMERVEVLRGPQGTLFGRNSTGGLINFITAKPTDAFEGYASMSYGRFNRTSAEAAFSGRIANGLRGRISGLVQQSEGYFKNNTGKNTFESYSAAVRAQVEADLGSAVKARLAVGYDVAPNHRAGAYKSEPFYLNPADGGRPSPLPTTLDIYGTGAGNDLQGYRDPYSSAFEGAYNDFGRLKKKRFSPTLYVDAKFGGVTVSSISNYTYFSFNYTEDCDGSPIDACRNPIGQKMRQYSQELRINGSAGAFTYTAGAYYLNIKQQNVLDYDFPSKRGTSAAFKSRNLFDQNTESYAGFGQIEYQPIDLIRLTVGGRYTRDAKSFSSQVYLLELGNAGGGSTLYNPGLQVYDFSAATVGKLSRQAEDLWTGKAQIDVIPNADTLLYGSVSRGVKGAGFNSNLGGGLTNAQTPFRSESVMAYELGGKFKFLDRKLRVNAGLFYYDIKDFQGYAYSGIQGIVSNYPAIFKGAELEVRANPWRGFEALLGGSYVESTVKNVPTFYSGIRDQQGVQSPKWTVNGLLRQSIPIGSDAVALQWTFNYVDDRYASLDNNIATLIKGSFVHNARISYDLKSEGLELSAFVDNIGNTERQTFGFDLISTLGSVIRTYGPPRWWGVSARKTF